MAESVEDTISTGAYWDPDIWQLARAAYVADLDNDPTAPDAFIGWIHRAIEQHAARGVRGRARLRVEHSPTWDGRRGFNRHHPLRASTRSALEQAIVEDRRTGGVVLSRSGFLREAVVVAVDASRRRAGGELDDGDRSAAQPPGSRLMTLNRRTGSVPSAGGTHRG